LVVRDTDARDSRGFQFRPSLTHASTDAAAAAAYSNSVQIIHCITDAGIKKRQGKIDAIKTFEFLTTDGRYACNILTISISNSFINRTLFDFV